jgi:sulfite reductase (NADPH) flavoprotein alpha-component
MTARQFFPEGALTLEQWQLIEQLGRTLTPAQARWISGYFAGLDAGLMRAGLAGDPAAPGAETSAGTQSRTLTILYGTETGNCRELAKGLAASAAERGLSPEVSDMANYKTRRLKDEQDLLIIVSTYGEGDPPQPSVGFFEFVEGKRAPKLEGVRFAVLALGDSTYDLYCEAGKRIDRRFEELGAERLQPRVDCDIDYDDPAADWGRAVLDKIAAEAAAKATAVPVGRSPAFPAAKAYDKRNSFPATVLENLTIVGRGSSKETRHIEIDISGSGISYEPGDALGLAAENDSAIVDAVLDATGLSGDAPVTLKGEGTSLREALARKFEITLATPRLLDHWAKLSDAAELKQYQGEDRAAERAVFLHGHHVIDIIRQFRLDGLDPETFLAGLRPLQPRLYSIASSLAAAPDEVHITVSPVRYDLHGEPRGGVASTQLADRVEAGATLPVYVQHNPHFRLPGDDVPIIMVGPGTGIAPFRSFMQEREARGAEGRSWLFFGERNFRSDFLYQTEWQEYLKDGVLTRMDVAFSRDRGGRVYVQDRMRERAADLFAWLEEGAHFYICGDATNMARDVHEALIEIVMSEGRVHRESAEDYVRNLQADNRYQRDVY